MTRFIIAALALACAVPNAEARPRAVTISPECNVTMPCDLGVFANRAENMQILYSRGASKSYQNSDNSIARSTIVGTRPAGCPRRYCGCGASLHLFGKIIPALNLAANWLRFLRAAPAPNMVAARRGHVFVLKRHIAGRVWLVHDSNSGGGKTRLHARSIAGFQIVNPHGGRYASLP